MIFQTKDGARRELFALFDSSTPIPRASQWGGVASYSGHRITLHGVAGLPAVLRGLRLISETGATLPWLLYRGFGDGKRPMPTAPQLQILNRPNPDVPSSQAFWKYVLTSVPGQGNGYIRKIKAGRGRRLKFLYALNPGLVTPKYEGSSVSFEIRDPQTGSVKEILGKDQIIHIPGILLDDPYVGVSVVSAHRHSLGNELGRQEFEGRYLANDAQLGVVLTHPGNPKKEQREEVRGSFDGRHAGPGRAGRTGMMWGGWDLKNAPITMADAQFIEAKRYSVQEIGRMLGIPSGLLNDPDAPGSDSPEKENMRLLQLGVMPWLDCVSSALAADTDLFPEGDWTVENDDQGFLKADIHTRWDAYRLGRQGGWITANDIRRREGLPPASGGDDIQVTPVGGAPNQSTGGGGANADQ